MTATPFDLALGQLVRTYRVDAGLTGSQLQKAMQIRGVRWNSYQLVHKIENGERRLLVSELTPLADVLGVLTDALLPAPPRHPADDVKDLIRSAS